MILVRMRAILMTILMSMSKPFVILGMWPRGGGTITEGKEIRPIQNHDVILSVT